MTEEELRDKILQYIVTIYEAEYKGLLLVEKLNPGYKVTIGLPSYMTPSTIATDIDDEQEFLDFIYKEFKSRNYMRVYIYKVIRTNESREE